MSGIANKENSKTAFAKPNLPSRTSFSPSKRNQNSPTALASVSPNDLEEPNTSLSSLQWLQILGYNPRVSTLTSLPTTPLSREDMMAIDSNVADIPIPTPTTIITVTGPTLSPPSITSKVTSTMTPSPPSKPTTISTNTSEQTPNHKNYTIINNTITGSTNCTETKEVTPKSSPSKLMSIKTNAPLKILPNVVAPENGVRVNGEEESSSPSKLMSIKVKAPLKILPNVAAPENGVRVKGEEESDDWKFDSTIKPPHSYATLIYQAIQFCGGGKVTLAQIYDFVTSHFDYYGTADPGWKNSIRHNLTQHKCFLKIARKVGESGKGGFWALDTSYESMFEGGAFKGTARRLLSRKPESAGETTNNSSTKNSTCKTNSSSAKRKSSGDGGKSQMSSMVIKAKRKIYPHVQHHNVQQPVQLEDQHRHHQQQQQQHQQQQYHHPLHHQQPHQQHQNLKRKATEGSIHLQLPQPHSVQHHAYRQQHPVDQKSRQHQHQHHHQHHQNGTRSPKPSRLGTTTNSQLTPNQLLSDQNQHRQHRQQQQQQNFMDLHNHLQHESLQSQQSPGQYQQRGISIKEEQFLHDTRSPEVSLPPTKKARSELNDLNLECADYGFIKDFCAKENVFTYGGDKFVDLMSSYLNIPSPNGKKASLHPEDVCFPAVGYGVKPSVDDVIESCRSPGFMSLFSPNQVPLPLPNDLEYLNIVSPVDLTDREISACPPWAIGV